MKYLLLFCCELLLWNFNPCLTQQVLQNRDPNANYFSQERWRQVQSANQNRAKNLKRNKIKMQKLRHLNQQYDKNKNILTPYTLLFPNDNISRFNFSDKAMPVSPSEASGRSPCSFIGAYCPMETVEHNLVRKFVEANDTVLELGARFGTTTCEIAHKLKNSINLISVEPDKDVWNLLVENSFSHFCNYWLVRGVISDRPSVVSSGLYATRTTGATKRIGGETGNAKISKSFFTFNEIQELTNLRVSVLLIDCEGCINYLFNGNGVALKDLLIDVRLIILEGDMSIKSKDCRFECVDYDKWENTFNSVGFITARKIVDPVFPSIFHYVFHR